MSTVEDDKVTIDEVAHYYDDKPCNINHSAAVVGTKEFFDQVEQRRYFVESHIPSFAEFSFWKGKKVLDVGCGLGTESINFARAGALVTCVDISKRSVELTKQRFEIYGFEGRFYLGDAENLCTILPPGETFDLIWSFGVLHTTPHPRKVVDQMKKLLAPNGELRLMVYSRISYNLFYLMQAKQAWDFSQIQELISKYCFDQVGTPITYTFTFDGVKEMLKDFNITCLEKAHIFKYKVPEYKKFQYVVEDCWADVPPEAFKRLEKELGWHTLIRARLPEGTTH